MRFSNWTLRTRLIALTTALVAVTSVVIGAVTILVLARIFSDQLDQSVENAAQNVSQLFNSDGDRMNPRVLDQAIIIAGYDQSGEFVAQHVIGGDAKQITASSQLSPLRDLVRSQATRSQGARTTDVTIPSYGEYRFAAVPFSQIVIGESTDQVRRQVGLVLVPISVLVLLAVLLAGLFGAWIIGRALRPLRRVAAVASNVASLPLERGSVELPQRVPDRDTDPRTEVGQVGSALNNLLDSVASALAVRQASEDKVRNFVADASHELRTPLASIRGYAELTRRFGGDLTDDVQHNIGRIESEAQRMTSLVEDLLLLARLDAERELDTSEVDLSRLLVDVIGDAHAAGPDHEWDLELPEEPVVVRGDPAKLQQVFTNLLANARVHTPAGTRVAVELAEPHEGRVLARVKDDGPGIPENLRPELFGRFVRGDASRARTTGSTGLGLSIVSAVIEAHHGSVSVTSEPGSTVFTVDLPVEQPAQVPQPA